MHAPLEALVEREGVTPNWALAVELGQQWRARLCGRTPAPQQSTSSVLLIRRRAQAISHFVRRDDAPSSASCACAEAAVSMA
jgi:hypothetical protein